MLSISVYVILVRLFTITEQTFGKICQTLIAYSNTFKSLYVLCVCVCVCVHVCVSTFLIRSYGIPNGTERCPVVQCHDKIWATLAQQ